MCDEVSEHRNVWNAHFCRRLSYLLWVSEWVSEWLSEWVSERASACVHAFVFVDGLLSASLECVCSCQGVKDASVTVSRYPCISVCVWIENLEWACVWVSGKLGIRTASYECSEASLGATRGSVREKHNLLLCFVIFTLFLSQVIALATQIHLSWLQSMNIYFWRVWQREMDSWS